MSFGYDGRGNLTSSGVLSFGYNKENQLISGPGGTTLYYDPLGRLSEYDTNVSTRFYYSGAAIAAEIANDGTGSVLRRYVMGPGTDEPIVWYEGSGTSDRRFLQADERGSIIAVTDSGGSMLGVNSYDEYGVPGLSNMGRFQYTGQAWYGEVGLYNFKARWYSPTQGRFMQTDPIGYGDGLNWHNYAHGDPVNGTDPSGEIDPATIVVTGLSSGNPIGAAIGIAGGLFEGLGFAFGLFGGGAAALPATHATSLSTGSGPNADIIVNGSRTSLDLDTTAGLAGGVAASGTLRAMRISPQSVKTCSGRARGLAGNTRLYGKMGAFATVRPNTAAIIPYQFGGSRKADLRPYVSRISGSVTGTVGGRTVTSTFNGITDVIDGASPIPGVGVRDAMMQLNPNQLIIEIPGGADVGSNASVILKNYPSNLACPTGTR